MWKKTEPYFGFFTLLRHSSMPTYPVRVFCNSIWGLREMFECFECFITSLRTATREMNLSRYLCAALTITDTSSSILLPYSRPYSAHNRHEHVQRRLPITTFGGVWSVRRVSTPAALVISPAPSPFERRFLHNNDPHTPRPSNLICERVISQSATCIIRDVIRTTAGQKKNWKKKRNSWAESALPQQYVAKNIFKKCEYSAREWADRRNIGTSLSRRNIFFRQTRSASVTNLKSPFIYLCLYQHYLFV